jgi:hypothetical protein
MSEYELDCLVMEYDAYWMGDISEYGSPNCGVALDKLYIRSSAVEVIPF